MTPTLPAFALLACPVCGLDLEPAPGASRSLRCASGHAFDLTRQGSATLLARPTRLAADDAEMVARRIAFLQRGLYAPIADAVANAVAEHAPDARALLDVGAGPGWYAARLLDARPALAGLALDLSKAAIRRAATAHPRLAAAVADVTATLPVRSASLDVAISVFAPRPAPELARVLRPGGLAVIAAAAPGHLDGLIEPLGLLGVDARKEERLAARFGIGFDELELTEPLVARDLLLPHPAVRDLVGMGPNAFHQDAAALEQRIAALPDPTPVALRVRVTAYRRR